MKKFPEPDRFPDVPEPEPYMPARTPRRDRYGNPSMASRAKPKPVPERRPKHETYPLYSTRNDTRGVQAACSCGYVDRIWHELSWPFSMEQAAVQADQHARGLR